MTSREHAATCNEPTGQMQGCLDGRRSARSSAAPIFARLTSASSASLAGRELASKRINSMIDTTEQLDGADEDSLAFEFADEQLEAAADPTKPLLWTYPTTSCGGTNCPW
jgi:hypothetical protein